MEQEAELLRAVIADPDDDKPRLAYATWCDKASEEAQRLRGEFIRLQLVLPTLNYGEPSPGEVLDDVAKMRIKQDWLTKSERHHFLLQTYGPIWAGGLKSMVDHWEFDRGFVAGVTLSTESFLEVGPRVLDAAPIKLVSLSEVLAMPTKLFVSPLLEKISALDLKMNGLTDDHMTPLAKSTYLKNLCWLDLSKNKIKFAGVETLARQPSFRQLPYVGLQGNPCDPLESAAIDGLSIQDIRMTPEGERLEQRHGRIRWLHYETNSVGDYPPSPFGPAG